MTRVRLLGLLLCSGVACTSFQDAVLSYAESDAGEQGPDVIPAAESGLDAEVLALDADTPEVVEPARDASVEPRDAAPLADTSLDAAQVDAASKSCCLLLAERLDAGLINPLDPLDPLHPLNPLNPFNSLDPHAPFDPLACSETVCQKLPASYLSP